MELANPDVKSCPFCAETILAAAVKCKHCGENVSAGGVHARHSETLGVVMLIIPVVTTFLIVFWVGNMALIENPGSSLNLLLAITIIATAGIAALEAKQVGAGSDADVTAGGKKRSGPLSWFFVTLFLWAIAFPAWLYQRKKYGLKNLVAGGILVTLIFGAAYAAMGAAVESKRDEIRESLRKLGE